jgi:serine/threonine protein kinase
MGVLVCSGYMPPEYVIHGRYSIKSDVFSFGVLMLKIISEKKNNHFYQSELAEDLLSYVSIYGSYHFNFFVAFMKIK